jgi:hypothetical protein
VKKSKRKNLTAAGWRIGTAKGFLGLSDEEDLLIDIKFSLADALRKRRARLGMTQAHVAGKIGSSQSRLAKMESAEDSVSIDLLVRALLELGASRKDVAAAVRGNTE